MNAIAFPTMRTNKLSIVSARDENLARINALIARSKAHWNWPEGYLERALPLLRLSVADLKQRQCFEAWTNGSTLAAFISVDASGPKPLLDNLWVAPEFIGKGVGTRACEHIFELARAQGWPELLVMPDPPSEGFYARIGFSDTGERVPSRVPGGPVFSIYRIRILTVDLASM